MMKFTRYDAKDSSIVELQFQEGKLPEIIEQFEHFLRGCGFTISGYLDINGPEVESHRNDCPCVECTTLNN